MASVFQTNEITQAGLRLIAESSSANPIAFVDALSASQIPQDPEDAQGYNGIGGTIDASSATDATARVVALFGNTNTSEAQVVKAIAIRAKLASQSDSDAVIFAYSYDADSAIYLPSNTAPSQRTRFAFAFDFSQTQNVSVTEAGSASLADLERFVSCHKAGNPNAGEDQSIFGDKYWYGQQDFDEACRFYNAVVTHSVWPETDNAYSLGLQNARYNAIYGETVNSTNVMTSTVSANDASIGSLHVGTILNGEEVSPDVDVELGSSLSPEHTTVTNGISSVYIGSSNARFGSVYAGTVNGVYLELNQPSSSNKATLTFKEDALLTDKDIVPAGTTSDIQSCGRLARPWKEMYVKNAIYLTRGTSSTTDNLIIYEDDGGINFDNSYAGGDGGSFAFRKRAGGSLVGATVSAGEFFGAPMGVVSLSHTPSTLPNSDAHADAPTWNIKKGTIVMAMPCWATARSVFMNRKGAGDSITVTFPDVSKAPFQHGNDYDTDPEKGAWYIASWKCGSGNSPKSGFVPLSTQDSSSSKELFSYLPAGTYRLLCCVEECVGVGHSEYHPEGMCVLLQKIS